MGSQCEGNCQSNIDGAGRCNSTNWPNWWPQEKHDLCYNICYNNHNSGAEQTPVENRQVAIEQASAEEPTGEAKSSTELGRKSCTEYCASRLNKNKYKGCWDDAQKNNICSHLCEGSQSQCKGDCPSNIDGAPHSFCNSKPMPERWPETKFNLCRDICHNNHNSGQSLII